MAGARALEDLSVAVAHWHVRSWGGAEYLVTRLAEALDVDEVHTLGPPSPDKDNPYGDVDFVDVVSDLGPPVVRRLQLRAGRVFEYSLWEDVDWRTYGHPDVLVTSGATTRAVITPEDTLHLNYCHSPPRWLYDLYHDRKSSIVGRLARPLIRHLRTRDMTIDPRVDGYFVNSPVIARRLSKYYKRDSEVLYPPIDVQTYRDDGDEGFYLHLGRLDDEKGVGSVIEAFIGTDRELVLAGGRGDLDGDALTRMRAAPNIEYEGFVSEGRKRKLLATCRAVVFNGRNEDFGIVPIEANASGKPCLVRDEGFPAIFIRDGENGYVHDGTPAGILESVETLEARGLSGTPSEEVEQFSLDAFESALRTSIEARYRDFSRGLSAFDTGP